MHDLCFAGIDNIASFVLNGWGVTCEPGSISRDYAVIKTEKGILRLRILDMTDEGVMFVNEAKEYIYANGFKKIDRYIPTVTESPFLKADGSNIVLDEYPVGRECDFGNDRELEDVSRALGLMHKASRGFRTSQIIQGVNYLGLLPSYYRKRCDEMKRHLKEAKRGKGKFDLLYANCGAVYCDLAEEVIAKLTATNYYSVIETYKKRPVVCHHDIIYRNTIMGQDGVNIINFEMCCIEIRAYDIINLVRRRMRKCGWDKRSIKLILDAYREVEDFEDGEFEIMKLMLVFPQKLWRIVNKYYNSRRGWGEKTYISQLLELIDEMEESAKIAEDLYRLK
jgi:spore coat protein I